VGIVRAERNASEATVVVRHECGQEPVPDLSGARPSNHSWSEPSICTSSPRHARRARGGCGRRRRSLRVCHKPAASSMRAVSRATAQGRAPRQASRGPRLDRSRRSGSARAQAPGRGTRTRATDCWACRGAQTPSRRCPALALELEREAAVSLVGGGQCGERPALSKGCGQLRCP
jgi:hypothetical protein